MNSAEGTASRGMTMGGKMSRQPGEKTVHLCEFGLDTV